MREILIVLLFALMIPVVATGQIESDDHFMHPGINSAVLDKGHFETRVIGTYGLFYNDSPVLSEPNLTSQDQRIVLISPAVLYGLMKHVNVGIVYQFMHIEEKFAAGQTGFTSTYTNNSIGPQIRIKIFSSKNTTELYIQSHLLVPLDDYIPADKITYVNQLVATGRVGYNWAISLQIAGIVFPKYNDEKHPVTLPASLFVGYLIKRRAMPFVILNHNTDFGSMEQYGNKKYYRLNYSTNLGIGAKYQIFRNMDVAAYYLSSIHSKSGDKFNSVSISFINLF